MRYGICLQEDPNWSLPACLQSVVKLRRVMEPSQAEISRSLQIGEIGFDGDLEKLNGFLKEYNLGCVFVNPFQHSNFCLDLFLNSEINDSTDVLVAYNKAELRGVPFVDLLRHFSIIEKYCPVESDVVLRDMGEIEPIRILVSRLIYLIQSGGDDSQGFYLIN